MIKFIPRCLIFVVTLVNGIDFLVSLSESSFLVYKNVIDFWMLIFYPATWLNSFTKSKSFLVESLGFSIYNIISSTNDSFTPSFQFVCLLFFLLV